MTFNERRGSSCRSSSSFKYKMRRRQTFHTHHRSSLISKSSTPTHFEVTEVIKPASNLSVPRIISQHHASNLGSTKYLHPPAVAEVGEDKCYLTVNCNVTNESGQRRPPPKKCGSPGGVELGSTAHLIPKCPSYLLWNSDQYLSKQPKNSKDGGQLSTGSADTSLTSKLPNYSGQQNSYGNNLVKTNIGDGGTREEKLIPDRDLDVQSIINERRPSKLKCNNVNGKGGGYTQQINSFNYIYARDEISDDKQGVDNEVKIYVDDTDSQSCSEIDKSHGVTINNDFKEEQEDSSRSELCVESRSSFQSGLSDNSTMVKPISDSEDVVSNNTDKDNIKNSQTNNEHSP